MFEEYWDSSSSKPADSYSVPITWETTTDDLEDSLASDPWPSSPDSSSADSCSEFSLPWEPDSSYDSSSEPDYSSLCS